MDARTFRKRKEPLPRKFKRQPVKPQGNDFLPFGNPDCFLPNEVSSHIHTFETGSVILDYRIPRWAEAQAVATSGQISVYIVLQGRVRILGQSRQRYLPYSATLLNPGELFGADHLFCADPLSYQAVAATTCQVVQVPCSYLSLWMDKYPKLGSYWRHCLEQRVQQLFFKRFTPLQTLPSHILVGRLLPQIQELRVRAGSILAEVIQPYSGYFWVRSGYLTRYSAPTRRLSIGDGWSSDNRYLADGIAQTPLKLFHLQPSAWKTPELLPVMNKLMSTS